MDLQTYKPKVITLDKAAFSNAKDLSIQLQIAEEIYNAACRQLEISQSVLTITAIDMSKLTVSVKGLEVPVTVTKEILEQASNIKDQWVSQPIGNQQSDNNQWIEVFDNALKGIDKIKPTALPEHIKNSVIFSLRQIK